MATLLPPAPLAQQCRATLGHLDRQPTSLSSSVSPTPQPTSSSWPPAFLHAGSSPADHYRPVGAIQNPGIGTSSFIRVSRPPCRRHPPNTSTRRRNAASPRSLTTSNLRRRTAVPVYALNVYTPTDLQGMGPSAVTPRAEMTRAQTHRAQMPCAEWGPNLTHSRFRCATQL